MNLSDIARRLDEFFGVAEADPDPAFHRYLPGVFEAEALPWRSWVEPDFATRFNGLMLRGDEAVSTVFLAAFPSDVVLEQFLDRAVPGDLLFVHHPIDLESGDPRGTWGRFFRPIPARLIEGLRTRRLSIYSCHAPLDYHATLSTSLAIARALDARPVGEFFAYGSGHAGVIAERAPSTLPALCAELQRVFGVPYLDVAGAEPALIHRVAIVAGAGDRVGEMGGAEALGAQAYITGEIRSRIETEYGRRKFAEVERFAAATGMALLGVSHAASEFLVMRTEMVGWFAAHCNVPTVLLAEPHWWR